MFKGMEWVIVALDYCNWVIIICVYDIDYFNLDYNNMYSLCILF